MGTLNWTTELLHWNFPRHGVSIAFDSGVHFSAITFEYLKAEIVSISKPYLENLVYK
jgi:hypothetical protein